MKINEINTEDWQAIFRLQQQAYFAIEPEDDEVLQNKQLSSPELCFVGKDNGQLMGYLLAHSWNQTTPPELNKLLPTNCAGNTVFLHDLAINPKFSGQGVGKKLTEHLFSTVQNADYQQIMLVSIQNSVVFWQKMGFSVIEQLPSTKGYGEQAWLMTAKL